ncbi:B12-binding domain-containing radical SAM protein [Natroniella acetigena]|uniref:B12-binding domain-containing radical SAM protein n=1 Tax=Natroniella acetigena TaxID=52004 RepID=UPI00200A11C4|nr:B12-binding domain-containing radical SAM protein [Natroniella acetigena]MCK8827453.1 B12-binding domain-containing radical SAM protein [Natroniella acetigena]
MNVLLTALNAKFIHSSLALRYLKSYCQGQFEIELAEYTINQASDYIAAEIYKQEPDLVGFSCYIWNMEQVLEVIKILKQVKPELIIVLGGPEVSYDPVDLMKEYQEIDYLVYGEGEETFQQLLTNLTTGQSCEEVLGLVYRTEQGIIKNEPRPVLQLEQVPSPYGNLEGLEHKIVYFETNRGCPFNCQYCLSSTLSAVRYFPLELVKEELLKLIKADVRQVKFVDRTFNCDQNRALEIFQFLVENKPSDSDLNFHFEITADLLSEEVLGFLEEVPAGYFQFEVGVQSTNQKTLELIDRKVDFTKLAEVVKRLQAARNIHLHLDLIAGLPAEDYQTFINSFNDVYQLRPGRLQLGFLKLLKGSGLREKAEEYGYLYLDKPPYQVLENKWLSYQELLELEMVEEVLETFCNTHHFDHSLKFIEQNFYQAPFSLWADLAEFWEEQEYYRYSHKLESLYQILQEFYQQYCSKRFDLFNEILKFDYLLRRRRVNLPEFLDKYKIEDYDQKFRDFTAEQAKITEIVPELADYSSRQIRRKIQIETFKYDVLEVIEQPSTEVEESLTTILFNYQQRDKIFNKVQFYKVEL